MSQMFRTPFLMSFRMVVIPLFLTGLVAGNTSQRELIETAKHDYFQGNIRSTQENVNRILENDPQNPTAQIIQGLTLLGDRQLDSRLKAIDLIENNYRKLSDNSFAYYALGKLNKVRNNPRLAIKYFQKAVELNPKFTEALIELGALHFREMIKYYHRYTDTPVPLSYRDYAIDDYDKAVSYLKKALRIDAQNKQAAYQLGALYYEMGEYDAIISLFERMLKTYPADRDLNLFLGLAHLSKHRYSTAAQYFKQAIDQMSPKDRELFLNAEYLVKGKKTGPDNDSIRKNYWRAKDPMFLTEENERLLEHYGRMAYANMRFSVPRLEIEGWETDRGKTYIRYGKPSRIIAYGKSMEPNAVYPPMEIWVYPDFHLAFSDEFWNDNFRFTEPPLTSKSMFKERTNINYTLEAENVFQEVPETFDFQLEGGSFVSPYQIVFFKGDENAEGLLSFGIQKEEELYEPEQKFMAGLYILGHDKLPVFEREKIFKLNYGEDQDRLIENYVINNLSFHYGSGIYSYSFEILNRTLAKNFTDRRQMHIPDFSADVLQLSDLLLARKIQPQEKPGPFTRNGLFILPNIEHHYQRQDNLFIYFEIYNLKPDGSGTVHYTVENSIVKTDEGFLSSLFGRDQGKVTILNDYSGTEPSDFVVQSMDIKNLEPGSYMLEILVKDQIAQTATQRKTYFVVIKSLTD